MPLFIPKKHLGKRQCSKEPTLTHRRKRLISLGKENKSRKQSSTPQVPNLPKSGCSLAWFRTSACHVDDPGSNPGDRTHPILCSSPVTCLQGPEANAKRTGQIRPAFPQVKFSKRMRKSRFRKNCLIGSL